MSLEVFPLLQFFGRVWEQIPEKLDKQDWKTHYAPFLEGVGCSFHKSEIFINLPMIPMLKNTPTMKSDLNLGNG